jgi:hypothetical protein
VVHQTKHPTREREITATFDLMLKERLRLASHLMDNNRGERENKRLKNRKTMIVKVFY